MQTVHTPPAWARRWEDGGSVLGLPAKPVSLDARSPSENEESHVASMPAQWKMSWACGARGEDRGSE